MRKRFQLMSRDNTELFGNKILNEKLWGIYIKFNEWSLTHT